MSELPARLPTTTVGQPVPAHHRPPNIVYDELGRPVHFTVGQPPAPQNIIVNLPEQQGMSREQREFMLYVVMWLVVAIVGTGLVCLLVVICGGTLMGIIGAVGANSTSIMIALVGVIVAVGWALSKVKKTAKKGK